MFLNKRFVFLGFALLCVLFNFETAFACSCGPTPNVLESFEGSENVVVVKAVSVEMAAAGEQVVDNVKSTKMVVEKVFKGELKPGDEMIFAQGGGADCIWTFSEDSVGKEYLFYLGKQRAGSGFWIGFGCGRSNTVEGAADDLLYLNNLDKARGKTRISGTLESYSDNAPAFAGRKIKIIGERQIYQTKTDKNGVYEIYGLPPGKYLIEPEIPRGWRVSNFYLQYSTSVAGDEEIPRNRRMKQYPIVLENKKHALLDFHLEIDNAVRGKIFAPDGRPMKDVCINAVSIEQQAKKYASDFDCTKKDGSFEILEIPAGNYILVVNDDGKIDDDEPFGTLFYPGVWEREKAGVISIEAGSFLNDIDIQIPAFEETIMVEGRFLYEDGKPVADESVEFIPENNLGKKLDDFRESTDNQGRFSLRILKGLKGKLFGSMFTYSGEYENCPKLEKLIKESGQKTTYTAQTNQVEIEAENNIVNVELRFPFPSCRKSKDYMLTH